MSGTQRSAREERLKAALRDNLRRRKAQARERTGTDAGRDVPDRPSDPPTPPVAPQETR